MVSFRSIFVGALCSATMLVALLPRPLSAQTHPATLPSSYNNHPWVTERAVAPRVQFHTFNSPHAGGRVSYHIYLPESYELEQDKRWTVVYWLHGTAGGINGIPAVARHFDNAIRANKIPPLIVVFVNGLPGGMYCDWKDGSAAVESVIIRDLVPHIDRTYRTIEDRTGRILEGFSMGGYGAARLGFKYPELFRAVSLLAAGPLQPELTHTPRAGPRQREQILHRVFGGDQAFFRSVSPWQIAQDNRAAIADSLLLRVVIGEQDEMLSVNREFHEHLERLRIAHTWTVVPAVGHQPLALLEAMGDDYWSYYRAIFERK